MMQSTIPVKIMMQSISRQSKGWLRVEDAKGRDKLLIGQTGGEV